MFTISLYKNNSENIAVDKNLTLIETIAGELNSECSIVNPVLTVEIEASKIAKCNYVYIPDFGRYYFVTNITSSYNGLWVLSCKVDVLMSYREGIRANTAIVGKNENEYNLLLNDGSIKSYASPHILTKKFPNGFGNTYELVMTVLG